MRSIRIAHAGLFAGELRLSGAPFHHLVNVLRAEEGTAVTVFDPDARLESEAVVTAISATHAELLLQAPTRGKNPCVREITWLHGMPKADKPDAIVRDLTELGATRIWLVGTQRSVVKLEPARTEGRLSRLRRIATEASRQCGRIDVPEVRWFDRWLDAVSEAKASARYCLHPEASERLAAHREALLDPTASVAFAVGPEGGLDDHEVFEASEVGFRVCSFGATVLRTETVPCAILGALCALSP